MMSGTNILEVYAKMDTEKRICAVESSVFLREKNGWIKIDHSDSASRDSRDAYAQAQGNYFPGGLQNADGTHKYIYSPERAPAYREATPAELAAELAAIIAQKPAPKPSPEEEKLDMLEQLVTMQAQIAQLQINTGGIER